MAELEDGEDFDFRMGDTDLDWLDFSSSKEKDWDESKHPRDPGGEGGGQFTSGGGGDGGGDTDEYGLGPRERQALVDWMGSGYRDKRTDPNFGKVLERLPTVTGRMWRGSRVTEAEFQRLKVGATFKVEKFSSTGQRADTAKDFMASSRHVEEKKIAVLFEINGSGQKIPRDVAREAGTDDEVEIVMMRGDRYKINSVEKIPKTPGANEPEHFRIAMSQVK